MVGVELDGVSLIVQHPALIGQVQIPVIVQNEAAGLVGDGAQLSQDFKIMHKWVERSNTDLISEMVKMMSAQRALQSAGQMLKIYDQCPE